MGDRKMKWRWLWGVILGGLLVFFIVSAVKLAATNTAVQIGEKAPDFELLDVNDNPLRLSDYLGQPVMINFFATWCPPCKEEAPEIQKFEVAYGDKIKILIIDRAEPKIMVQNFIKEYGSTSTYVMDVNDSLAKPFGIIGQPETFFIDSNGIVREHIIGPRRFEQFVASYEKLVNVQ